MGNSNSKPKTPKTPKPEASIPATQRRSVSATASTNALNNGPFAIIPDNELQAKIVRLQLEVAALKDSNAFSHIPDNKLKAQLEELYNDVVALSGVKKRLGEEIRELIAEGHDKLSYEDLVKNWKNAQFYKAWNEVAAKTNEYNELSIEKRRRQMEGIWQWDKKARG